MALGAIGGSKPGRGNTPWKNQGKTREGAELESAKAIVKALSSERQPPKRTFRTPLDLLNYIALIRSPLYESKSGATSPSTILKDPETAHRHIFSGWPRAPPLPKKSKDGKLCDEDMKRVLRPESSVAGKVAGNAQQIWGESLFDLYQTWRIPGVESYITWTSGSKMARWIEKYGSKEDKEVAEDALEWARDVEGDPRILFPKDVREAAREWEKKVEWGEGNAPPFSGPRPPKLQHRIMLHRLPKRLIVHDPYDLLGADETHFRKLRAAKATWPGSTGSAPTFNTSNARSDPPPSTPAPSTGPTTEVKDKTYVYNLHLSKAGRRKRDAELATLSQQRARIRELVQAVRDRPHTDAVRALLKEVRCGFVIPHFDLVDQGEKIDEVVARKGGKVEDEKWIFVMYGLPVWLKDDDATDSEKDETKKDDTSTSTSINDDETAHLYLSPSHPLGVGHHSIVYDAEWDLPRSTLFDGSILPPPTTLPDEVATVPIISMGTSTTKGVVCGQIGGTRAAGVGKADEPVDERHARAFRGLPGYGGTRGYSAFGREKDGFKAAHAPASASGSVGGREEEVYGDGAGGVDHIFDCDPVAGEMEPCVDGKDEWVVCKACVGERVRVWEEEKIKEKETGSASKGMGKERAEEKGYLELINTPAREPVYMPFDSPPPSPSSPSSPLPSNETKTTKSVYVLDPGALPTSSIRYTGPLELIDTGVEWVDLRDPGACEHLRSVGRRRWGGDEDEDGEGGGGWRFVARVGESGGESGGEDKDGDVHAGEQEKMEVEFEHGPENKEGSSRHVDEADESMKGIRLFAPGTVPKGAVVLGKIFVKVDEVRGGGLDEEAKMQAEAGLSRKDPRPTHVRTRLTAKLSLEHDDHLEKEAENYESFPGSFFERCVWLLFLP
ncbi:hypothetical protein CC2G_003580 [Coprinopsis cinerea AmutBmut pab1-1]|nr:hypothetical protein CC2G_003580 [Coprinopsis cinerea AmutBmut pab1-1]